MESKGVALETAATTLHCERILDLDLWVRGVVPNERSAKEVKWCEQSGTKCDFGENKVRRGNGDDMYFQSGVDSAGKQLIRQTPVAGTHTQNG